MRPRSDCSLVWLSGVGTSCKAFTLEGLGFMPLNVRTAP